MPHYRSVGDIPHKRHTQHPNSSGGLYYEELAGQEGFSADSALLYHLHIPAAVLDVTSWELPDQTLHPNDPFMARRFETHALPAGASLGIDAVTGRRVLLGNADLRVSYVAADAESPLYRNVLGDECLYTESGAAIVETTFGDLEVGEGDYVVIPRATDHRIVPTGPEPVRLYVIEANSHIRPPRKFMSASGQFLEHSPYCERDLRGPTQTRVLDDGPTEVYIKHRGDGPGGLAGSVHTKAHHPFDVVGWDGCLYPYAFNIRDYEPITGRVHQPPSVHQVFEGHNFVVCNFVPRKVDYHPLAIPVPYYHTNADSDEVMFYCGGTYEARKGSGIGQGSISLHPGGHTHGPQPGAYEGSIGSETFDELAVMLDTFAPLSVGEGGRATEAEGYYASWSQEGAEA